MSRKDEDSPSTTANLAAIRSANAAVISTILGIVSFIAYIASAILAGEYSTWRAVVVAAIILAGVILVVRLLRWLIIAKTPVAENLTSGNPPHPLTRYLALLKCTLLRRLDLHSIDDLDKDYISRSVRNLDSDRSFPDSDELLRFVVEHGGAVLLGAAGAGKSTSFFRLGVRLLDAPSTGQDPPLLPILISADDLMDGLREVLDRPHTTTSVQQPLVEAMWRQLFEPFSVGPPPADRGQVFRQWCGDACPILLIEGFDEFPASIRGTDLREAVLTALCELKLQVPPLVIAISSRPECRHQLKSRLRLPELSLEQISGDDVGDYLQRRWPKLRSHASEIVQAFHDKLDSRPLYLWLLCKYLDERPELDFRGGVSDMDLLKWESEGQISARSRSWDPNGLFQRKLLRRAASLLCRQASLQEDDLIAIANDVLPEQQRRVAPELVRVIKTSLKYDLTRKAWFFVHDDFRDYWLSEAISDSLSSSSESTTDDSLAMVMELPRVRDMSRELILVLPLQDQEQVKENLMRMMAKDRGRPALHDRTAHSRGATAFTIFLDCFSTNDLRSSSFEGCCFQGLDASDADLRDLRLRESVLRDSNLCGADLQNADLHGADLDNARLCGTDFRRADLTAASLRNAELGKLRVEGSSRLGEPTDFGGARLAQSKWFNYRIWLDGFIQFWDAEVIQNRYLCLATTGAGGPNDLWVMDLDRSRDSRIRLIPSGHEAGVVSLSFDLQRGRLATASRDKTVRVSRLDLLQNRQPDDQSAVLNCFANYPRRAILCSDGEWLAVADRAAHVYFFGLDTIGDEKSLDRIPFAKHSGPVMCLEAAGPYRICSAGYDGKVVSFVAPGVCRPPRQERRWQATEIADLSLAQSSSSVIRALHFHGNASVNQDDGLWIGDENGDLHYYDFRRFRKHLILKCSSEIFALTTSPDGSRLAVGLSIGKVVMYRVAVGLVPQLSLEREFSLDDDDIVRKLIFLDEGHRLLAVSWGGAIRIWSIDDGQLTWQYDVNPDEWHPQLDRDKVRFSAPEQIDTISGISAPFREYLRRLI